MSLSFKISNHKECKDLIKLALPLGLVFSETDITFALFYNKTLVGMSCILVRSQNGSAVFKGDFVLPEYRNRGFLDYMIKERLKYLKTNYPNLKRVEANAYPQALNCHLKNGANIVKTFKYTFKDGQKLKLVYYEDL